MVTTLRALDQELPQKRLQKRVQIFCKSFVTLPKVYSSPYLEPYPKPKIPRSNPLPRPPLPKANFAPYTNYTNEHFVVANEDSRWYDINYRFKQSSFNKMNILNELYPAHQKQDENRVQILFQEFTEALRCYCHNCHTNQSSHRKDNVMGPVYRVELEQSQTKKQFLWLAKCYQTQLMIKRLVTQILFDKIPNLNYIRVCINCPECKTDFEMLQMLLDTKDTLSHYSIDYDKHFLDYIFWPAVTKEEQSVQLLQAFNLLAKQQGPIDICVKDVWFMELQLWNDKIFDKAVDSFEIKSHTRFNPKDNILMENVLKLALSKLRHNPKFVLAALPNSHKVPLLMEWIRKRYGLKYSSKDRREALRKSTLQWEELLKHRLHIRIPTPKDVCRSERLTYGEKNDAMKCVSTLTRYFFYVRMACIQLKCSKKNS